ncbi:hypothetical protein RCO28_19805 [Streptomyces sp. LHD-70]|uniref:hypothetical protein n=1 Tax=Streptomyces sp. LHD-70 TaxID=3072140 RepID=UPI00280FD578|nr:hypothetical protein [Streptomyces sp. LHD-70]MDQ8704720.1 hypothetical protein [Streptomyces sp. LHD-70]
MVTIATTGHMDLTGDTAVLVRRALDGLLAAYRGELVGLSCIAEGADALFAEAVLAAGGRLVAVIPSRDYRTAVVGAAHAETFDRLVEAASEVLVLPYERAGRAAYEAANAELLGKAERLVAVWDGSPPTGKGGGTADVVEDAHKLGIPVEVVWPHGAARGR